MQVGELFVAMAMDFSQFDKDEATAKRRTMTLGNSLSGILKNAFSFTIGMGMFQALQQGFRAVVGETVNFNSMMEQAQIGFTTMLGSAEKANAFLEQMADFAAKTPFEFPDLLESAKRMLAMGFAAGDILPTIEAVGNAAAGLGLGREGINRITLALGQMQAKSKVTGEEMRQLTEAGVPAWQMLAEAMGVSTAEVMKMSEKGLIPANKAIQILTDGMNKRFPDMMKNMENTWQGVTSTIKDVWRMTIGALTSNLFKGLTTWLQGVRNWATDFYDTFRRYGLNAALVKGFGSEFASAVNFIASAIRLAISYLKWWYGILRENWAMVKIVASTLLIYAAATKTAATATWLFNAASLALKGQLVAKIPLLSLVSTAMGIYRVQMSLAASQGVVLTGVLARLRIALYAVQAAMGPIGWILLAVSGLLAGGMSLWGKYTQSLQKSASTASVGFGDLRKAEASVAGSAKDAADANEDQTDAMKEAGKAAGKNVQSFDEIHQMQEEMATSASDMALDAPSVGGLPELPNMSGMLAGLEAELPPLGDRIKGFFGWLWDGIKSGAVTAWNWITRTLKGIWQGFVNLTKPIWEPIGKVLSAVWQAIVNIGTGIWQAFIGTLSQIWENLHVAAKTIFGAIYNFIVGTWTNFTTAISTIWNGIWTFLTTLWNNFWTMAGTIWQAIADLITGKIDLRTAVTTIWNAIKTFFSGTWNSIKATAGTIWSAITQLLFGEWSLIQETAAAIWGAIIQFFSDSWNAIKEAAYTAWDNIKTNLSSVWDSIKTAAQIIWDMIKGYITTPIETAKAIIERVWKEVAGSLERTWEGIKRTAGDVWNGITSVIKGAINGIIGMINNFIKAFNKIEIRVPKVEIPLVGTVGGWSIKVPQIPEIPMLAKGGLVTNPTLAMLGEAGPEAVIPLGRSGFADDLAASVYEAAYRAIRDAFRAMQTEQSASGQSELVLNIDGQRIARAIIPAITKEGQRIGSPIVQVQGG